MLIVETETMVAIRIVIKLTSLMGNVEMRLISLPTTTKIDIYHHNSKPLPAFLSDFRLFLFVQ